MPDDKVEAAARGLAKKDGVTRLRDGLSSGCSNVYALLQKTPEDFAELRVKQRAAGDFMGILKYYAPDGTPMVVFGWGYDALTALMGLNAALAAGKGRIDRPWAPGENGG